MRKTWIILLLLATVLHSCTSKEDQVENWKKEIIDTEKAFSDMAQQEGIAEAFAAFAAEDVVLMRNDQLVLGKEALKESLQGSANQNASLSWEPDFVEVAASGDLGYTYGKYIFTLTDSAGTKQVREGIFHTVWKRQEDGSWKFVWD